MNIKLGLLASAGLLATVGLTLGCGDSASTGGAGGTGTTTTTTTTTKSSANASSAKSTGATPTVGSSTGATPTVGSSSGTGGGNDCANYCSIIEASCTGVSPQAAADKQYASNAECLTACAAFTPGTPGATTGNTLACRIYHATVAGSAPQPGNADTHCAHAGKTPTAACI